MLLAVLVYIALYQCTSVLVYQCTMYPQGVQSGGDGLSPSVLHNGCREGKDKTTFQGIFWLQLLQVLLVWFGLVE